MDDKTEEKVWSPEDLRNASTNWNLAGDRALLQLLETMHKDIIDKTEKTTGNLNTLLVDLEKTSLSLKNVNNRFMGLSNTQFVENRVQEDDIEIIKEPDKETNKLIINPSQTATIKEKEKEEAMRQEMSLDKVGVSLTRLENLCDRIHISPDTDSESDDDTSDEAAQRTVLRTHDIYSDRPLPFTIGSIKWQKKWHIGLKDCSSDSEDDDDGNRKQTELEDEFSDTQDDDEIESANNSVEGRTVQEKKRQMTLPIKKETNIADNHASSLTSTSTENSTDTTDSEVAKINSVPKSFSETISTKKNDANPLAVDSIHEEEERKLPRTKIANASDFAAELARKLGSNMSANPVAVNQENVQSRNSTSSGRSKGQNFNPGLSKLPDTRVTGNVFLDEPPPIDVYNDEKDDLFGNYQNDDEDEDEFLSGALFDDKPKQSPGSSKLFKPSGLFGEKKPSNLDGLFDDLPGDEDNFDNSIVKNKKVINNPINAKSSSVNIKKEELKQKNKGLFDDDYDDFNDFKIQTDKKSASKGLFDDKSDINDRIAPIKNDENINKNTSNTEISKKNNNDVKNSKKDSLFGDDDDDDDASSLFSGNQKFNDIKHVPAQKTIVKNVAINNNKARGVAENQADNKQVENVANKSSAKGAKNSSLFGGFDDEDDDDDIFASLKKSTVIKSKISTAATPIGGGSTNASSKQKSKGLFDNDSDGEDLFSSLRPSTDISAKEKVDTKSSDNVVKREDNKLKTPVNNSTDTPPLKGNSQSTKVVDNSLANTLKSMRQKESSGSDSDDFDDEKTSSKTNNKTDDPKPVASGVTETVAPSKLDLDSKKLLSSSTWSNDKVEEDKQSTVNISHKETDDDSKADITPPKLNQKPEIAKTKPLTDSNGVIIKNDSSNLSLKPEISKLKPKVKSINTADVTVNDVKKDSIFENMQPNVDLFSSIQSNKTVKKDSNEKILDSKYIANEDAPDEKNLLIKEEPKPLIETTNIIKRPNALFDDIPPPLDVVESFPKEVKDVNSLFDDEEEDNDDDLFSKFRTKTSKNDKPSKGLFDDVSPNIVDIMSPKRTSDFGLFNDEPPDLDDINIPESKDDGASDMFADYPYYKTVNIIKSSNSSTAVSAAEPSNISSFKKDTNSVFDDFSDDNDLFATKTSSLETRKEITGNKDKVSSDSRLRESLKTDIPVEDSLVQRIPSMSKPNIVSAKPQVVSVKPDILSAKPGISTKPEIVSTKPNIPIVKPESTISKSDATAEKSDIESTRLVTESKKPDIAPTKPKIATNKHNLSKPNSSVEQIISETGVPPKRTNEESLKIDQNISAAEEKIVGDIGDDHKISDDSVKNIEKELSHVSVSKAKIDIFKNESKTGVKDINKDLWESKKDNENVEQKMKTEVVSPTRTIGKLQTSNFNINVKALIPGISPKLVKEISEEIAEKKAPPLKNVDDESGLADLFEKDKFEEITKQTSSLPTLNLIKDVGIDQVDRRAPLMKDDVIKSVSFDSQPNPGSDVLSNAASKERVRIQVKRRPSSRRARQEAIRKSVIDVTLSDDGKNKNFNDFTTSLPTSPVGEKVMFNENYSQGGSGASSNLFDNDISDRAVDITIPTIDRAYKIEDNEINTSDNISQLSNSILSKPSDDNTDLFSSLTNKIDEQLFKTVDKISGADETLKKSISKELSSKKSTDVLQEISAKEITTGKAGDSTKGRESQKVEKKEVSSKKTPSLFGDLDDDDVDLFASGKNNMIKSSVFGRNDFEDDKVDIFTSLKSKPDIKKDSVTLGSSTGAVKKNIAKKPSVFDDLDDMPDIFAPKIKNVALKNANVGLESKNTKTKSKNLFENDNEDDLFFRPPKSKEKSVNQKSKSLFSEDDDDDDFDIFNPKKGSANKQTKPTDITVTKSTTVIKQQSNVLSSAEVTIRDPLSSFLDD